MPRLSLWKNGTHSNDYRFFDRRISEMFTLGGTGILCHKYLGVAGTNTADTATPTTPYYDNASAQNIQDLLFLENRDRKYDPDVYIMRGIYQVQDNSFDLSQFGLFLQTGTLFMTFHINDMVQNIGRKLMNGDVLELQHLTDYNSLDNTVPVALKRFFVVSDCQFASEGFTPTWWPHLWRVKLNPMTDSQEYKDILNNILSDPANANSAPIGDYLSNLNKYLNINDAVVAQAELDLPKSGYDTSILYTKAIDTEGKPGEPPGAGSIDTTQVRADNTLTTADRAALSSTDKVHGYLSGDGLAPNGMAMGTGIVFPVLPDVGDYFLRLDYLPNRLFRYDGRRWNKIEDAVRTTLTPGENKTQLGSFINNENTWVDASGVTRTEKTSLSKALKPKADN
jgi:hypothetical protein